jgi:hypothetical protein
VEVEHRMILNGVIIILCFFAIPYGMRHLREKAAKFFPEFALLKKIECTQFLLRN